MLKDIRKILTINPGGIGDLIMFTPALRVLCDNFPGSKIDVFVGYTPVAAEVLRGSDFINKIFNLDFSKVNIFRKIIFIYKLIKENYDLVIVASGVNPLKGEVFALLTGAKNRAGEYRKFKCLFYTHQVKLSGDQHKIKDNFHLLESLGIKINVMPAPFFVIKNEDKQFGEDFIFKNNLKNKIIIGFSPAVGQKQQFKGWAKENFIELGRKILNNYSNSFILIFGSSSDRELCLEIRGELKNNALEIVDYPLKQVATLIDKCKIFVAPDCGLGHIAATTGADLIVIFGPTILERTGPVGKNVHTIEEKCRYRYHDIFTPKYDVSRKHECLKKITPERVFNKIKKILQNG